MGRTERRVVSIVFADLVGFTTLSERLDPEDVALVHQEYFAGVAEVLADHDGQVEKFIGDAVVATFGLPHAHDDDVTRAVFAGMAIVEAVAAAERRLSLASGTLQVRVGVNTGEVVVVRATGDAGSWRLAGDVVNTAARLQAAAAPGNVLIGPETAFAAAHAFFLEPLGPVELKGKAAPTAAWRVAGKRPVPSRQSTLFGWHTEVVGRDRELALLEVPEDQSQSYVLALAAEAAAATGDRARAAELRPRLERWRGHHVVLGSGAVCLGSVSHHLGLLLRTLGDLVAAAEHLDDAVRMNEALGAAPAAARSRIELARTLLALGRREAEERRDEAAGAARRLGLVQLVDLLEQPS